MNRLLEHEIRLQSDYWVTYWLAQGAVAFAFVTALANDLLGIGLFGLLAQFVFNIQRVPLLLEDFELRRKIVTFKTQIENIYVFTQEQYQNDEKVADSFYRTIELLKEVENKHEVRVHMILFQDVQVFTWFIDRSGKIVKTQVWREVGSANETWGDYQNFIQEFEAKDRDERLRQLRKDAAGFDWVNENLFGQWPKEKQ